MHAVQVPDVRETRSGVLARPSALDPSASHEALARPQMESALFTTGACTLIVTVVVPPPTPHSLSFNHVRLRR